MFIFQYEEKMNISPFYAQIRDILALLPDRAVEVWLSDNPAFGNSLFTSVNNVEVADPRDMARHR
jgi:hypothetical protein